MKRMTKSIELDIFVGTWNVNSQEPLEEYRKSVNANYHQTHRQTQHGQLFGDISNENDNISPLTDIPNDILRIEDQEYKVRADIARDIGQWLQLDKRLADIYAIGFQEIEMTGKALVTEQTEQKKKWEHVLKYVLSKQKEPYVQLCIHQLVGLCLAVYVKKIHVAYLESVRHCIIREGLSGVLGNKGAIAARFDLYDLSLCFINCHLTAHQHNITARNNNLNSILSSTKFVNPYSGQVLSVTDHPIIFVFGDFNYRIDNSKENWTTADIQNKISNGRLKFLLKFDQLSNELAKDTLLLKKWGFSEGEITFAPTYKYITGSDVYDSEENAERIGKVKSTSKVLLEAVKKKKDRIPSWTDRIFFHDIGNSYENLVFEQTEYGRCESKFSDHKPVYANFHIVYTARNEEISEERPRRNSNVPPPIPKHLLDKKKKEIVVDLLEFDTDTDTVSDQELQYPTLNSNPVVTIGEQPTIANEPIDVEQVHAERRISDRQINRHNTAAAIDSMLVSNTINQIQQADYANVEPSKKFISRPLPNLPPKPADSQIVQHSNEPRQWQPPQKPGPRNSDPLIAQQQIQFNPRALDKSRSIISQKALPQPDSQPMPPSRSLNNARNSGDMSSSSPTKDWTADFSDLLDINDTSNYANNANGSVHANFRSSLPNTNTRSNSNAPLDLDDLFS